MEVEIWDWKEREELEERYLRWVLGVEGRTPWYLLLVREELQRDKLNIRPGRRVWARR